MHSASGQPSRAAARLKAEGAGTTRVSAGVDMPRQHRADAVVIGIAGGEHANLAAALRQHLRDTVLERRWPGPRRAADERSRKGEMALAAEHDLGVGHEPARHRREAFDPVLPDADDGQPARRCGSVVAPSHQGATCDASSFWAAPRRRESWRSASPDATISR